MERDEDKINLNQLFQNMKRIIVFVSICFLPLLASSQEGRDYYDLAIDNQLGTGKVKKEAVTTKVQQWTGLLPTPKVLADMMLQEKKTGKLDNQPYVTYLVDSLGYTMKRDTIRMDKETYQALLKRGMAGKVFTKEINKSIIIQVVLLSKDEDDGKLQRLINIQINDHNPIHWIRVRLREYGLNGNIFMKGKGLFADGRPLRIVNKTPLELLHPNSITIGCDFDKK